jgi:5-methylcytosine-specific restriction endonuclease McrA
MKYCPKCEIETERYADGRCGYCKKKRASEYYAANTNKMRARSAIYRSTNPEKTRASVAKWQSDNPEKVKSTLAAWRAANLDKVRSARTAWAKSNPDKVKAQAAVFYANNTDKVKAKNAAYYKANPEKCKATNDAWRAANHEKCRIYKHNRRAKIRENGGTLSQGLAEKLFKLQRGKCPCCGFPLGDDYHLDHIIPIKLGGSNTDDNIQLLRQLCNNQKSSKHPVEFMQSRGFLL